MNHKAQVVALFLAIFSVSAYSQISFFTPPTYTASGNTFTGDFNGDGKPDIISDGTVQLGNGDGTFTKGTGLAGTPLAIADFNGDRKLDVLEQGTGTLLVQLGNGDGTFGTPVSSASGAALVSVAAADLNGDGYADVVGWFNNQLLIYLGKGDGTFAAPTSHDLGVSTSDNPVLTLADFNGDGKADVAVGLWASVAGGVEIVLLGNGDGTFQAAKRSPNVQEVQFGAAGDFNNDGKLDLLVTGAVYPYNVSILLGNGDGTFQNPSPVFAGLGSFAVGDVNGDGNLDVVFQNPPLGQVYLGHGDGTFTLAYNYLIYGDFYNGDFSPPVIADFNGDSKLDVALEGLVLLGRGDGSFQGQPGVPNPSTVAEAVLGDFDKDGRPDVAAIGDVNVYILRNDGAGNLKLVHTYPLAKPGASIEVADFNGDGNPDLIVVSAGSGGSFGFSILMGNGDSTFQSPVFYPQPSLSGGPEFPLVVGDFNQDGKPDIAIQDASLSSVAIFLGNGDGTFASPAFVYDGPGDSLVTADFDGDGKADLAAAGADGVAVLLGKGDGTFAPAVFPITSTSTGLFTGDINGDGKADLVTGGSAFEGNTPIPPGVYLGKGDGTFTAASQPAIETVLGLGEFDGDGKLDVVGGTGSNAGSCCLIYRGKGDGTFGSSVAVTVNLTHGAGLLAVADMNHDGKQDLLVSTFYSIGVLLNSAPPGKTLTVVRGGSGSGTVTSSPTGINCGSTCSATYSSGTAVTLTAAAASGSGFGGWSGGGCSGTGACTVTLSSSQTVTASFNVSPAVTLTSSAATAFAQNPVTLTATLSSSTATGTVTFNDGTTALNTATVSAGTASYTTSALTAGAHSITAAYSGDSNHAASTSAALTENIVNFTVGVGSGGSSSATVSAGGQAQYTLALTPPTGGTFPGPITFAVSGLPSGATGTFNPTSIAAGAGATDVTLTVKMPATASAQPAPNPLGYGSIALGLLIVLAPAGRSRKWLKLVCLCLVGAGLVVLSGCGGSSNGGSKNPQPQTYTLTVTASSGSLSNTTNLTLIVQ